MSRLVFLVLVAWAADGCTTIPTQFHASERHCRYDRVGVDYELECSSKGVVELDDGPDLLEVVK